jgi:hypothetical protein
MANKNKLQHGINIQEYTNGSYAYFHSEYSAWQNIPSELAKNLIKNLKR